MPNCLTDTCEGLTTLPVHVLIVRKSGNLNLQEPYGPDQVWTGICLPFLC